MQDSRIDFSPWKLVTLALWAWMLAVWTASAVAYSMGMGIYELLGFTACMSSAVAATAQIRCYVVRICCLLRVTAGLETPDATVKSIR